MTVNVAIGNLEVAPLDPIDAKYLDSTPVRFHIPYITLPGSEALHTPMGPQNHADFFNGRLEAFSERVGITEVLFCEKTPGSGDFMFHCQYPGALWITPVTQETIRAAYERLQEEYPDYKLLNVATEGSELDESFHLLAWFDFWVTWALKNCAHPAIYLN